MDSKYLDSSEMVYKSKLRRFPQYTLQGVSKIGNGVKRGMRCFSPEVEMFLGFVVALSSMVSKELYGLATGDQLGALGVYFALLVPTAALSIDGSMRYKGPND